MPCGPCRMPAALMMQWTGPGSDSPSTAAAMESSSSKSMGGCDRRPSSITCAQRGSPSSRRAIAEPMAPEAPMTRARYPSGRESTVPPRTIPILERGAPSSVTSCIVLFCQGPPGAERGLLPHFVAKRHHAAGVGLHLHEVQRHVAAQVLEEADALADDDGHDRVAHLIHQPQPQGLAAQHATAHDPDAVEPRPQPGIDQFREV